MNQQDFRNELRVLVEDAEDCDIPSSKIVYSLVLEVKRLLHDWRDKLQRSTSAQEEYHV